MNSRRAMIKFNFEEYNAFDIGEILQCLPDNTNIVSIHKNVYNSFLNTVMVIENEIFKEVKESQEYPEVNILFDEDDQCFNVDYSDIIEINSQESGNFYISNVDKEKGIINFSSVPILDHPLVYLNTTGKIEKRIGCENLIKSLKEVQYPNSKLNTCNHSWKSYQGFSENYDYCEKCDEKKGK